MLLDFTHLMQISAFQIQISLLINADICNYWNYEISLIEIQISVIEIEMSLNEIKILAFEILTTLFSIIR